MPPDSKRMIIRAALRDTRTEPASDGRRGRRRNLPSSGTRKNSAHYYAGLPGFACLDFILSQIGFDRKTAGHFSESRLDVETLMTSKQW
jgi:hypothetical protein